MPETESKTTGRRRVLVTGAATGIGAAIVDVFVNSDADVVATFHEAPPPERSQATWRHCDVTSVDSVNDTVDAAVAAMGGLDAVIHAAGLWLPGIAGAITDADMIGSSRSICGAPFTSIKPLTESCRAREAGSSTSAPQKR